MTQQLDPAALLVDVGWLRALAARLAHDRDDGDDVAQDALVAAWRKQPDARGSLRPWLGKVARDGVRMLRRGRARQAAREQVVAVGANGVARGPEQLLAEAQLHQALVAAVLALDEPYRRTILARFVDGQAAAAIARAEGVPAGTVRWRQAEGLRRLRLALAAHRPRVERGLAAVGALRRGPAPLGGAWVIAAVAVVLVAVAALGWSRRPPGGGEGPPRPPPMLAGSEERVLARAVGLAPAVPSVWTAARPETVPVAGVVVDRAGVPIAGAEVIVDPAVALDGVPVARTVSDADGRFAIATPWHEVAVIVARAPGYADAAELIDPRGRRGARPEALVLTLTDCADRVEGRVRDAGGGAVPEAVIRRLVPGTAGRYQPAVVGDGEGRFSMCLPPGTSSLVIGAPGYEHVVREVAAHQTQVIDVALVPEARLSGQVVDAATGAPLGAAQLTLWPTLRHPGGPAERSALTGADGRFTLDGLAAGRFQLTAWAAGHVTAIIDDVAIRPAVDAADHDLALVPATTLRGVVTAAGQPVSGAEVFLERALGAPPVASAHAITAADGSFMVDRVPAEAGLVVVVRDHVVVSPSTVDAPAAEPVAIAVEVAAAITGVVVQDGRAVPGAELWLDRPGRPVRTRADGGGRFQLAVPPGRYRLGALGSDGFTSAPLVVDAPGAGPVTVALDGHAAIEGRVVDRGGQPVIGVVISAHELARDDRGASTSALDGSFRIAALAGGHYRLRVDPYPGATAPLAWLDGPPSAIALADGRAEVSSVVLRVDPMPSVIAGTVVDGHDAPVTDAYVRLGPAALVGGPVTRTGRDGRFTLAARGPGPFTIEVSVDGEALARVGDLAPGARDLIVRVDAPE